MRKFMKPERLWGREGGPDEDWVRPHVLWMPEIQTQVNAYFDRIHEVVARYPDVITPVQSGDAQMTIQSVGALNTSGVRVDGDQLKAAAAAVHTQLRSMDPFDIEIGPARLSESAAVVEIWPETGLAELNHRVRNGLLAAGMELPPEETHFWPHMLCGYGAQDTDTPELAARSDQLASELGKSIRPGIRTSAIVDCVWLGWMWQRPGHDRTYMFEPAHDVYLSPLPTRR